MFTHNDKTYIGSLVASKGIIAMLSDLGVTPTETILAKLKTHCGTALYSKAIVDSNEKSLIAVKAEAIVKAVVKNFRPGKRTQKLYATWVQLSADAETTRVGLAAIAAMVSAMEQENDAIPTGSMSQQIAKAPPALAAADAAFTEYASELLATFKAHIGIVGKKAQHAETAIEYAKNNVALTLNAEELAIDKAEIKAKGTRRAGTGTGVRRGFLKPVSVAGIAFPGKWSTLASQLLAAGAIEVGGNFALRPALERAARELKDKTFVFAGEREVTGADILADVDAFRTPEAAS